VIIPNDIQHQLNADQVGGLSTNPGVVSKLCLSCHDASVAVSSYGNLGEGKASSKHTGSVLITATAGGRFGIGVNGNLQNHHPIGFDYTLVQAVDDEIADITTTLLGNNPYGLTIENLLWGGRMECSTCHDVHNTKNTGSKFVWVDDENSNLCLSCHLK
jgi:predicted CXXCH cytochrome family protein